jgi:4'-phosphopantetheinyl transferase EntD
MDLPLGRCVGVEIPALVSEDSLTTLRLPEQRFAEGLTEARRPSWVAGRIALRAALDDLGIATGPLLATDRGAPLMPAEALGSISHKRELAVGLAARREGPRELGVDLERDAPLRIDISRRVLTEEEAAALSSLAPDARQSEVLLRLSCKEAIYKAIDPFVRRYVGFQEAAVTPRPDGTAEARLALEEGPFEAELCWRKLDTGFGAFFLTAARIRPAGGAGSR